MKKLMLAILFVCSPIMAQDASVDSTSIAVNTVLMGAAIISDNTPKAPDMVTDEVTMPDGSKAYLKHNKNSGSKPLQKSNVIIDKVSKFDNYNMYGDNIYVYPITVKGTPCVVVSAYRGLALSCNWKQ